MVSAKEKEVKRKIFHIILGLVLIFLIMQDIIGAREIFWILVIGFILSLVSLKFKIPVVNWFLKSMERDKELKKFPGKGAIFFFVGILLAIKLFSKDIALAAIIIMVLGDGFSHLVGVSIKKSRYKLSKDKNIEGIIAGIIIGGIGASFFVNPLYAFAAAFVAMFIEGFGVKLGTSMIDDNIIVPLVSGTIIYLFETGFRVLI